METSPQKCQNIKMIIPDEKKLSSKIEKQSAIEIDDNSTELDLIDFNDFLDPKETVKILASTEENEEI